MNRVGTFLVVASFLGIAAVVGCSSTAPDEPITGLMGNDPNAGGDNSSGGSIKLGDDDDNETTSSSSSSGKVIGGKDAGAHDGGTSKDGGASSSSGSTSSGGASSSGSTSGGASSSGSTSSGGTSSGGTSSGGSSSGGSSSGGTTGGVDPCKDTACGTAIAEASMSGDTGSAYKNLTGATSRWFTVRVTEDYHSVLFGQSLTFKATLTSPPGANYDLYLYRPDSDVTECTKVSGKSENATGDDSVRLEWGEGADPNGEDDSRTVTVEVREVNPPTTCDPTATWTLKLQSDVP